jgi:hypothetical protein
MNFYFPAHGIMAAKIAAIADGTNLSSGGRVGLSFSTFSWDNEGALTERMRITKAGNVGIGTTSPWGKLSVTNTGSGPSFVVEDATSPDSTPFIVDASGNVGIGSTTPWKTLSVTGTVGFDGVTGATGAGSLCLDSNKQVVYNSASDACLSSTRATKHDISPLDLDALAAVIALQPVSFVYNDDASSTVRYGFIAEDTELIDRSLATHDKPGAVSGIDDRAILSVVVKAVQEILAKIASFAERLTTQMLTAEVGNFQKLCVGSTCVTEAELRALLDRENVTTSPPPSPDSPTEPPADEIDDPETPEPETQLLDVEGATSTDGSNSDATSSLPFLDTAPPLAPNYDDASTTLPTPSEDSSLAP